MDSYRLVADFVLIFFVNRYNNHAMWFVRALDLLNGSLGKSGR